MRFFKRLLGDESLGVSEVRAMLEDLLSQPHYRENAKAMQREIEPIDGPVLAAEIIEKATSTGKPVYREA